MTENKVEEILKRIGSELDDGEWRGLDPYKLAEILVEMEERIAQAPIEHCGVEDCPECNKEAYKAGYLAALEEVREKITQSGGTAEGYIDSVLDELKKKYDRG